jgi:hypothetical protein
VPARPVLALALLLVSALPRAAVGADDAPLRPATGPLTVHPTNPRYFTDGTRQPDGRLRAVYLTGSHTWNNLVDMGRSDPPEVFDYEQYLAMLARHGHNFIRLWAWDSTRWDTQANRNLGQDFVHTVAPQPWLRTGPGVALDGKPKFDLTRFNPAYFERLKARVARAGEKGIYVSVMLFEGWGLLHGNAGRAAPAGWAWRSHPFHPDNNINGIDASRGDGVRGDVHSLKHPAVNTLQAAYIRQVVDTVNDQPNLLYEVINEGGLPDWDWWVVQTLREHERGKATRHPVGITGHGKENLASMLASPADWISPGRQDGYGEDPPAWRQPKVSLHDTDHIWGVGGNPDWVWKSFLRGHNPIYMDPYDGSVLGRPNDPSREPILVAMGVTRRVAGQLNLAAMEPRPALADTGYCLAQEGREYLVYQPKADTGFAVTLAPGTYALAWLDPRTGHVVGRGSITATGDHDFKPPSGGPSVLRLQRQ